MAIEELNKQILVLEEQIEQIRLTANAKIKKLKDRQEKLNQKKNQFWLKTLDEMGLDKVPSEKILSALERLKQENLPHE